MEHAADLREIVENSHGVAVGLPLMDDHRKVELPGQSQLRPEGLLLHGPGHVLVVVVQADLADGHHLLLLG